MTNLQTGPPRVLQAGNLIDNPNYVVTIRRDTFQNEPPIAIQANLPESFSFNVNASFEQRLPSDLVSVLGDTAGSITPFYEINRIVQEFSHQTWQSSSPIEFSLPLIFDAVNDAERDVIIPIMSLMKLALPQRKTANDPLLRPPGGTLRNPNEGRISLKIGNMNYFHSVLINDVSPTFNTRMTQVGTPISAECDLSVTTINTPIASDIDLFFYASGVSDTLRERYGSNYNFENIENLFNSLSETISNNFGDIGSAFARPVQAAFGAISSFSGGGSIQAAVSTVSSLAGLSNIAGSDIE